MFEYCKCGGKFELVDVYFHMHTYRCTKCSFETYALVSYVIPEEMRDKTVRKIYVKWVKKPLKKEIYYLRKVVPKFKQYSVTELIENWESDEQWFIGHYSAKDADKLRVAVMEYGLLLKKKALEY